MCRYWWKHRSRETGKDSEIESNIPSSRWSSRVGNRKPGYSVFDDTIADMTWIEVEETAKNNSIMLVPVRVIEQHGPYPTNGADVMVPIALFSS